MSSLFTPAKPKMPEIPRDAPGDSSAEVTAARERERKRAALAQGRQSTILTGGGGVTGGMIGGKTKLGQ